MPLAQVSPQSGGAGVGLLSRHLATSLQAAFDLVVDALTMRALVAQETGADPHRGHVIVTVNLTQKVGGRAPP
jgi:hypothetical protein